MKTKKEKKAAQKAKTAIKANAKIATKVEVTPKATKVAAKEVKKLAFSTDFLTKASVKEHAGEYKCNAHVRRLLAILEIAKPSPISPSMIQSDCLAKIKVHFKEPKLAVLTWAEVIAASRQIEGSDYPDFVQSPKGTKLPKNDYLHSIAHLCQTFTTDYVKGEAVSELPFLFKNKQFSKNSPMILELTELDKVIEASK
jgi:hypothetical protein